MCVEVFSNCISGVILQWYCNKLTTTLKVLKQKARILGGDENIGKGETELLRMGFGLASMSAST